MSQHFLRLKSGFNTNEVRRNLYYLLSKQNNFQNNVFLFVCTLCMSVSVSCTQRQDCGWWWIAVCCWCWCWVLHVLVFTIFLLSFFFLQETIVIKLQIYIFLNFPSFFSVTLDYRNDKMIIMGIKVNLPLILSEIQCIPSLSWYFCII